MRSKFKGPFVNRKLLQSVEKINAELEKLLNKDQQTETDSAQNYNLKALKIPAKI
eukprot:SAG22_NODE_2_length_61565_cov_858.782010_44_plen_55_part_00